MNINFHEYFKGKKVLIMGLGRLGGGEGVARFFAEEKAQVTVTDLKGEGQLRETLKRLKDLPLNYVLGRHRPEDFQNQDIIIRNPDVPRDSEFLKIAQKNKIPLEMDESLFLKLCPVPVIGVTGTRGKTTTTRLIGEVLKEAGYHTLFGGNLPGVATLSLLRQITPQTKVVLELSSWQLEGLGWDKVSPHIAVVTNIYPDHLNRYKNMDEYIEDKKLIFRYQVKDDYLVLNRQNKTVKSFASLACAKVVWFEGEDWPKNWPLKIPGAHNLENAAAAYQVGKILGVEEGIIQKAVGNFPGVPHRLEVVRQLHGVTYVDDSTSTTPVSGVMALRAYNCNQLNKPQAKYSGKPIILIVGGNTKNLDFSEFISEIVKRVKAVVLLEGTATDEIESGIRNPPAGRAGQESGIKVLGRFDDFKRAILVAQKTAKPGDVILLSPACTSFGIFENEFDRGEKFKEIVKSLT